MNETVFIKVRIRCVSPNNNIPEGLQDEIEPETEFREGLLNISMVLSIYPTEDRVNSIVEILNGGGTYCVEPPVEIMIKRLQPFIE